jgi:signal transduction histidine kinase
VDDGPGLDQGARARMFDRYWRATAEEGGAGLGLALVRAVAELHEGRAEARGNASGRGLEVSITFPKLLDWH